MGGVVADEHPVLLVEENVEVPPRETRIRRRTTVTEVVEAIASFAVDGARHNAVSRDRRDDARLPIDPTYPGLGASWPS